VKTKSIGIVMMLVVVNDEKNMVTVDEGRKREEKETERFKIRALIP